MQTAWKNLRQKKDAYVVAKRKITEDGILPESLWGDTVTTGNIDIGCGVTEYINWTIMKLLRRVSANL